MSFDPSEELLTARDVAAVLRCSLSLVYALARQGTVPCVKIGGLVRFRRSDIEVTIAQGSMAGRAKE